MLSYREAIKRLIDSAPDPSRLQLSRRWRVPESTIRAWNDGQHEPSLSRLCELAEPERMNTDEVCALLRMIGGNRVRISPA